MHPHTNHPVLDTLVVVTAYKTLLYRVMSMWQMSNIGAHSLGWLDQHDIPVVTEFRVSYFELLSKPLPVLLIAIG